MGMLTTGKSNQRGRMLEAQTAAWQSGIVVGTPNVLTHRHGRHVASAYCSCYAQGIGTWQKWPSQFAATSFKGDLSMSEAKRDCIGDPRDLTAILPPLLATLDLVVPGLGSAMSATWSEFSTGAKIKRIEEVIAKIRERLTPDSILNSFATSPAAMQLLEHVLRRTEVEHSEQKRDRFANLIVSRWVTSEPIEGTFDESMLFAEANSKFTDSHVAVLQRLYERGEGASVSFGDLSALVAGEPDERSQLAIIVLDDLCSEFVFSRRAWGLNDPDVKHGPLVSTGLSPEGIASKCRHAITKRGRRYVDYVVRGPAALVPSHP
jgi:hypothetical protein